MNMDKLIKMINGRFDAYMDSDECWKEICDILDNCGINYNWDAAHAMVDKIYRERLDNIYKWNRTGHQKYSLEVGGQEFTIVRDGNGGWMENTTLIRGNLFRICKREVNEHIHKWKGLVKRESPDQKAKRLRSGFRLIR